MISIVTGNVMSMFFIGVSLFYPLQTWLSVVLFIAGIVIWLFALEYERSQTFIKIATQQNEERKKKYRIGNIIG